MNTQEVIRSIFTFNHSQSTKGIRINTNYSSPQIDVTSIQNQKGDVIADSRIQTLSQISSNGPSISCKNNFISTLVNKIRSVERVNSCKNLQPRIQDKIKSQIKIGRIVNNAAKIEQTLEFSKPVKRNIHGNDHLIRKQPQQDLGKIYNQCDLQQSIKKMKDNNTNLKNSLKLIVIALEQQKQKCKMQQKQLQTKNQQIVRFQEQSEKRKIQYQTQINQLKQQIYILKKQYSQLQIQLQHLPNSNYCTITATVNQIIFPIPDQTQIKADQLIRQLKTDLLNNQKKTILSLAHLRKIKDEQIQVLRCNFFKNLNHYKSIIVKCTSKVPHDQKKLKEGLLESTIIQTNNSSNQS